METKVFHISTNPEAKKQFFGNNPATVSGQPAVFEMIEDARFHNRMFGDAVEVVSGTPENPGICIFKLEALTEVQKQMTQKIADLVAEEQGK